MARRQPSVLVVDDDPDTCQNLGDILTDLGYRVATAGNARDALGLVRREAFDVALLDLKMPDTDGLSLYRAIKKIRAGTVAIIVTAYAEGDTADAARAAGAWQILPKPVDFGRLLPLLSEAVAQPLVLLVDDDHELCAALWDLLRERGYRVSVAHGEREAEELLRGDAFRVVLIDMKLREGDGARVFQFVRRTAPQTRTVLITGHRSEMEEMVGRVLAEGADAACYKPFDIPHLLETLRRLSQPPPGGGEA